jgi:threonine-phosphate decarboxylase
MKPISSLVRENVKDLKPCVHGGAVLDAVRVSGFREDEILDFSSSVNPLGPAKRAVEAVKNSFGQIAAYPDSNSDKLRETIAEHFGKISKSNVIVGNGSTELMYLFAESFLKKGEKAVIPTPTFGEYENAVRKTGEKIKFVSLGENFRFESSDFSKQFADAKIIFLCNPNNPTSILISKEYLTQIIEIALKQNSLVFLDEDFLEFVEDEKALSMIGNIKEYPNMFILRSFTKIYGLTGLRIGYGIASEEIISTLLCAKIPWNVNCFAQVAAVEALKDEAHLKVTLELIKKEKTYMSIELGKLKSCKIFAPDANFFFIDVRKSGFTAHQLKEQMLSQGILIRDCSSFRGLDNYFIRVAIKTRQENERLIEVLKRIINNEK